MAGKPHKFTRPHVDRLMRGIRMGLTYRLACMFAGISEDTLGRWRDGVFPRNLDDEQKQLKADFADMLSRAEGDAAARHVSTIMQAAAQGDANISIKFLERRWPEEFGMKKVEVTGKDGGPVQVNNVEKYVNDLATQVAVDLRIEEYGDDLVKTVMAQIKGRDPEGSTS